MEYPLPLFDLRQVKDRYHVRASEEYDGPQKTPRDPFIQIIPCRRGMFIYPYGRGSTANSGVFVDAVRNKVAPVALINRKTEPMIIVGSVLAQECYQMTIPVLDQLDPDPIETVKSGDIVRVDGKAGTLEIVKRK